MPRNIEIKARITRLEETHAIAARLSGGPGEAIMQEDVFFRVEGGRLKLRILSPSLGQLIYYERADKPGPKTSSYSVVESDCPAALHALLTAALGERATVRKLRHLYLAGRTRIHLDAVQGLGDFLELEVVLQDSETERDGEREARALMAQLGIDESDLVEGAYVDLLATVP
ncbi:MAG: class IV adenylate cyclase [Rhodospirillales bacterium]